ncbi:L-erythro-3,5-diaminohexanoate dehydrogenase [Herbidospora cretacea]|uniref:L-erythro-3,5-diaminohexanoate dehydrogenase n=1 Tax=Herbidospora cretacea TaxID=28444 RepID=UPI001FE00CA1|nr:L-erythro-3,5-diaminohexanoate dehydrogenase [Herbidospora cretacea]
MRTASPIGLHRVLSPPGALPQAAHRLDASPGLWPGETRLRVERLNLDAASYRQLSDKHHGDGAAVRGEVLEIIRSRGKMHNPVTGSGGMLVGVVEEGPAFPAGTRVATLVSLTLTPLVLTSTTWDGLSEQVPCDGHAILFERSVAAELPADLPVPLALAVMDVCGAPALTQRVVLKYRDMEMVAGVASGQAGRVVAKFRDGESSSAGRMVRKYRDPVVAVLGAAGKSGSLSLAAARRAGARTIGVVLTEREATTVEGLADRVLVADARDAVALADLGADVTVVCVDVPGCEHAAILATRDGGTVVFFSMATSFPAAALGAEGLGADVTMLIGNGYAPGHAALALDLLRAEPGVRAAFEERLR